MRYVHDASPPHPTFQATHPLFISADKMLHPRWQSAAPAAFKGLQVYNCDVNYNITNYQYYIGNTNIDQNNKISEVS